MTIMMHVDIDFPRKPKRVRQLPLVPMIDVVFILIVFFMLTTNYMRYESLELWLPAAENAEAEAKPVDTKKPLSIILKDEWTVQFGERAVDDTELRNTLQRILSQAPEQKILLLVADSVSMQRMVDIMDLVTLEGGKGLMVRAYQPKGGR
jgi:biopolymer transport protein ExbD